MLFYWSPCFARHRTHPKLKIFPCKKERIFHDEKKAAKGEREVRLLFLNIALCISLPQLTPSLFLALLNPMKSHPQKFPRRFYALFCRRRSFSCIISHFKVYLCWYFGSKFKKNIMKGYNNFSGSFLHIHPIF